MDDQAIPTDGRSDVSLELEEAYARMTEEAQREAEAGEWTEALLGDAAPEDPEHPLYHEMGLPPTPKGE